MPDWEAPESPEELRRQHHDWSDDEINSFVDAGRLAILTPPEDGKTYACVKCGEEVTYISVYLPEEGPQEQVNHHCHCSLSKEEFTAQAGSTK